MFISPFFDVIFRHLILFIPWFSEFNGLFSALILEAKFSKFSNSNRDIKWQWNLHSDAAHSKEKTISISETWDSETNRDSSVNASDVMQNLFKLQKKSAIIFWLQQII